MKVVSLCRLIAWGGNWLLQHMLQLHSREALLVLKYYSHLWKLPLISVHQAGTVIHKALAR